MLDQKMIPANTLTRVGGSAPKEWLEYRLWSCNRTSNTIQSHATRDYFPNIVPFIV